MHFDPIRFHYPCLCAQQCSWSPHTPGKRTIYALLLIHVKFEIYDMLLLRLLRLLHRNAAGPIHLVNVSRQQCEQRGGRGQVRLGRFTFHALECEHLWWPLRVGRVACARTPQESQHKAAQHSQPTALRSVRKVLWQTQFAETTS